MDIYIKFSNTCKRLKVYEHLNNIKVHEIKNIKHRSYDLIMNTYAIPDGGQLVFFKSVNNLSYKKHNISSKTRS